MRLLTVSQKTVSHSHTSLRATNDLGTAAVPELRSKPKCCGGWLHWILAELNEGAARGESIFAADGRAVPLI